MATLPQLREELHQIAVQLALKPATRAVAVRLSEIADEMKRRPPTRRAPPESVPMTPGLRRHIRKYAKDHPTASVKHMANHFGVGIVHISETLAGKRT